MLENDLPFSSSVFSVAVDSLAPHCNPAPCVLAGKSGSISVINAAGCVTGDALFIRPGMEHWVSCPKGGIRVLYLDGLPSLEQGPVAQRLHGELAGLAMDALAEIPDADREVRERLSSAAPGDCGRLRPIIRDIIDEPMSRMTQDALCARLRMDRTSALRMFKAATGQTFRRFKRWSALQYAARQIAAGASVRTAAMDAGFADTAHLSRTFRGSFGLSPSEAIAGLPKAQSN